MLNLGELATAGAGKGRTSSCVLMNDRGYGVIRNIQDAHYGGRRYYADLHTPDFERLAQSIALPFHRVRDLGQVGATLRDAFAQSGPVAIEIDMTAIGPFATQFSGPPVRKAQGG